jgi:hypothetical protein
VAEGVKTVEQGDVDRPTGVQGAVHPGDLTPFVPERLSRAYESRRAAWSTVDTVAAWLLAAHLLLLLVIVSRGSFYIDDLRAQGYALDQPFWNFIMSSNGTHFAPIPRVLDWTQSRLFPLQHGPAVAVTLIVRLLLAIGFWRVLRRLFGARPVVLVPYAILLVTPALVPVTTYYRQSITVLACTVAIVWALDAHLRWVLYRHRGDLIAVVVLTAIGLACFEKAAAIPVILLAVTLALFAGRAGPKPGLRPGAGSPIRAGVLASVLSGLVVVGFLIGYRSGPYDQGPEELPSFVNVLRLGWDTLTHSMIPLLLGGPFHWGFPTPYVGTPLLSSTAIAFCLVIAGVGTVTVLWLHPGRTVRAVLLLLAWSLPSVVIVAAGRFDTLGLQLATAVRLWADLVPAFLLAGALAALPWRVGVHREPAAAPGPAPVTTGGTEPVTVGGAPIEVTMPALTGGLVVLLVLGGSVFSSLTFASQWWNNPTGQWIANARMSLENAEPYPRTLATPLPLNIMPAFVSVTFPTDAPLLLLLRPDMRFHDADGESKVMNASGVRSSYLPNVLSKTTTKKLCAAGLPAGSNPVTVKLPNAVPYALGAQAELGLLLAEPMKIEVTVTTPDGKVLTPERYSDDELTQGPHTLRVPVPYLQTIDSITVTATRTKTSCVAYARVWAPLS